MTRGVRSRGVRRRGVRNTGQLFRRASTSLVLLVTLTAGCAAARNSLGTTESGCYLALPTASAAVHHRGHLVGVRLDSVDSLRRAHRVYAVADSKGRSVQRVCIVAYVGRFTSTDVEKPAGHRGGHVAIVVLEFPHTKLLGTVVLRGAPLRFGHPFVGYF